MSDMVPVTVAGAADRRNRSSRPSPRRRVVAARELWSIEAGSARCRLRDLTATAENGRSRRCRLDRDAFGRAGRAPYCRVSPRSPGERGEQRTGRRQAAQAEVSSRAKEQATRGPTGSGGRASPAREWVNGSTPDTRKGRIGWNFLRRGPDGPGRLYSARWLPSLFAPGCSRYCGPLIRPSPRPSLPPSGTGAPDPCSTAPLPVQRSPDRYGRGTRPERRARSARRRCRPEAIVSAKSCCPPWTGMIMSVSEGCARIRQHFTPQISNAATSGNVDRFTAPTRRARRIVIGEPRATCMRSASASSSAACGTHDRRHRSRDETSSEKFVTAACEDDAPIIAISSMMVTPRAARNGALKVQEPLHAHGLEDRIKIIGRCVKNSTTPGRR